MLKKIFTFIFGLFLLTGVAEAQQFGCRPPQVYSQIKGACIPESLCLGIIDAGVCVDKKTNAKSENNESKKQIETNSENNKQVETNSENVNFYDGSGKPITLINPLGDNDITLPKLIERILSIALKIGTPLVALAIIYTGYLFIAAQGNPTKLGEAKKTLVFVLIGAAILLGAYAIAKALVATINAIRG